MHRTLKALVAVATGLALLALTAAPSAATLGTATAGTGTVNLTPVAAFDLYPGGTATCASNANTTLDVTMTSATAGTVTIDLWTSLIPFFGSGFFLHLGGTGSVAISGGTMTTTATLAGNVYLETSPGSCTPDLTTPMCGTVTTLTGFSLSGSWTGTVTPPALSGTAVLSGNKTVLAACTAPLSALNGRTVTISNLTVPF